MERVMPPELMERIYRKTILNNPYIPHIPTLKQKMFLLLPFEEAFYGGAGGGGKSDALLMGALQFVDFPGYAALLLRQSYSDLTLPEALMDRASEWLDRPDLHDMGIAPKWSSVKKTYTFPSGATLTFGYLASEKDKYRYRSAAFHYIGFDELTDFTRSQYKFLFSRLRRLMSLKVPGRMRSASNPGGPGHDWVRDYMVINGWRLGRPFIPAWMEDNPHLDAEQYSRSLDRMDPVERNQIKLGDWDIRPSGNFFRREWFKEILQARPADANFKRLVRYWDKSSTPESASTPDPDWTVGLLMGRGKDDRYYVLDMVRFRGTPLQNKQRIRQTAERDGTKIQIVMEEEGGSSGKDTIDDYRRVVLPEYNFRGDRVTGSKTERAGPVASQVEAGNLILIKGSWNDILIEECNMFPPEKGGHDDIVDTLSGAFNILSKDRGNPYTRSDKRYIGKAPATQKYKGRYTGK